MHSENVEKSEPISYRELLPIFEKMTPEEFALFESDLQEILSLKKQIWLTLYARSNSLKELKEAYQAILTLIGGLTP